MTRTRRGGAPAPLRTRTGGKAPPSLFILGMASLAVALFGTLGACRQSDRTPADTSAAAVPVDSALAAPSGAPAATDIQLTDGAIFAFLHEANEGEIDAATLASERATNREVQAFARQVIADHGKMQRDGETLAVRLKIVPKPMAGDSTKVTNRRLVTRLRSTDTGHTFDTAYVNSQIAGHSMVLAFLELAEKKTSSDDVKHMLADAAATVQRHYDAARALQIKLAQ